MKKLTQEKLDKIVSEIENKKNIYGSVFHVESSDKSVQLISTSGNFNPDTTYYIASINKLIISFIALRLCVYKKINLEDKIAMYLPEEIMKGLLVYKGKDYSGEISISHLISHTSGLPCYLIDKSPNGNKSMDLMLAGNDQSWPFQKVVEEVKKMKSKFRPGAIGKASYSETNFRLLERILETVTKTSIKELLTQLFQELNMNNTYVLPSGPGHPCEPIYFKNSIISAHHYWESTQHDIASTAADQMRFLKAFFEGPYFSTAFLEELKRWNNIFFPFKYGIGIQKFYMPRFLSPFKAVPEIIGHCGSVGSIAFYIPEKKMYITGTVNQTSNIKIAFQTLIKIINKL